MGDWGPSIYGDPCRECRFDWGTRFDDARQLVADLPRSYGELVSHATGNERHADLGWSVSEYVSHVGDNLRIWAERLMGVVNGAAPEVGGYNENELADARDYKRIPLQAAMWSLLRSVDGWQSAVEQSRQRGTVLIHQERGRQTVTEVVLSNAHDAFHHRWDIGRSLDAERQ